MKLSIIAAIAENGVIGRDNRLIWHMPDDLKRFKALTMGHHIIMGRKTFESNKKPLPGRTSVIITRNPEYQYEGCIVVHSIEEALEAVKGDDNPFIIGGAEIYKIAMPYADEMLLTFVHHSFEGDTIFPEIDSSLWEEAARVRHPADERNAYDYSYVNYVKK